MQALLNEEPGLYRFLGNCYESQDGCTAASQASAGGGGCGSGWAPGAGANVFLEGVAVGETVILLTPPLQPYCV